MSLKTDLSSRIMQSKILHELNWMMRGEFLRSLTLLHDPAARYPNTPTRRRVPQSTTDRPIVLSAHTGPWIWVNQYIIHIFMQCALKIICVFSVIIHQNIDPKSTENPITWRGARMHDFVISICCGQNHSQKKHPHGGVLIFALTPRSGGLGLR